MVTEHWKTVEQLKTISINNYDLAGQWCIGENQHGGAAVYVRRGVKHIHRSELSKCSVQGEMECAVVECELHNRKYILVSIYRPCNGNKEIFFDLLEGLLIAINKENKIIIIGGDFNIELREENRFRTELISIFDSFSLVKHISEDTRITHNTNSCIDNIFSNLTETVNSSIIFNHISDHSAQKICFKVEVDKYVKYKQIRLYSNEAKQDFFNELGNQNWLNVFSFETDDVNGQWNCFFTIFSHIFEKYFPKKKIIVKNENSKEKFYDDPKISQSKHRLDVLFCLSSHDVRYKTLYRDEKRKYDDILIQSRKEYYNNRILASDNKNKSMWNICKQIQGKISDGTECRIHGSPESISKKYNEFLITMVPNLLKHCHKSNFHCDVKTDTSMYLKPFLPSEISDLSNKLKNKYSSGIDEIPINIVKLSIVYVKEVLCYIINNSFRFGIFPDQLKMSMIVPVFKSGDPGKLENYRPINLSNSFSKIFEIAMATRLIKYFNDCDLFSPTQHGYLGGRSAQTATFQLTTNILKFLEENKLVAGLFIDLSKAFDCINRDYMIKKLEQYGIVGSALSWFASYLSNRWQCVKITKCNETRFSEWLSNEFGVFQGSILGVILFLIYINDLSDVTNEVEDSEIINFADDTNILVAGQNTESLKERCSSLYSCVENWFSKNGLVINTSKTNVIVFRASNSKEKPAEVSLNNQVNNTVENTKFLGIIIHEFLKWNTHINDLLRKLNRMIFAFRVVHKYINENVKKILYYANYESLLRYGIIFWGVSTSVQSVFISQKRILRIFLNMGYRDSCRGKFRSLGLLTVYGLYLHECLLYLHKNKVEFLRNNTNFAYNTRTANINYPQHKLSLTEKNPSYMCIKIFNSLPNDLKIIQNYRLFKSKTKTFLINLEPYNLGDYFM